MIKTTTLSTLLLTTLLSLSAYANDFKFNNKNLNALMGLVCQSTLNQINSNSIYAHKLSVDKTKLGSQENETSFELSGTCNIEYDQKSKEVITYGDEFFIEINLKNTSHISGKIGIKEIELQFTKGKLVRLEIKDPLMLTKKSYSLVNSKWAQSDSIVSFHSNKSFDLKIGRKTAAVEDNTDLTFRGAIHSKFFNTWSFASYGCSKSNGYVSSEVCHNIVTKIK